MLLTKNEINRPGCKFSKYFRWKRAVKSRTHSRPRPRIQRSLRCDREVSFLFPLIFCNLIIQCSVSWFLLLFLMISSYIDLSARDEEAPFWHFLLDADNSFPLDL